MCRGLLPLLLRLLELWREEGSDVETWLKFRRASGFMEMAMRDGGGDDDLLSGGVGGVEVHDGGDNVGPAGFVNVDEGPATFVSFCVQLCAVAGRPRFK